MNPLEQQIFIRCRRKRTYRKPADADAAAERASLLLGELIISYQCYECLKWHIGHADTSQILARTSPGRPVCEICWRPIDFARLEGAKRKGTPITTCSKLCQRELLARTERQNATPDPVPKGLPKRSS